MKVVWPNLWFTTRAHIVLRYNFEERIRIYFYSCSKLHYFVNVPVFIYYFFFFLWNVNDVVSDCKNSNKSCKMISTSHLYARGTQWSMWSDMGQKKGACICIRCNWNKTARSLRIDENWLSFKRAHQTLIEMTIMPIYNNVYVYKSA